MDRQPIELADVLRVGFAKYTKENGPLPPHYYNVVNALQACHTPQLGGHAYRCDRCSHEKIAYNSCRNRHCPSCQAVARAVWVDNRIKELLPVPYFHVVFTIPAKLNPFALRNKESFYTILFKAASETLHAFAKDPKYLGAEIGFLAIQHTWGQNLLDHPHLHCVVPAGGLADNRWKKCPYGKFLFPVKAMSAMFKGKFLDLFRDAVKSEKILFHGTLAPLKDPARFRDFIHDLYATNWVVYAKPPFAGPEAVLKYLGRYTHRIAIANSRIVALTDTTVSFTWKDYADGNKRKTMTLTHSEFIRRFLMHVVPPGFVRIRYYGFLSHAAKKVKLTLCKQVLGVKIFKPLSDDIDKKSWERLIKELCGNNAHMCPVCEKGRMVSYREILKPPRKGVLFAAA